jgi:hypothetical protein
MDTLLLKSLDPGVSTGGADPDPSGIASYSVAGAPAWNQASLDRAPDEAATGAVAETDDLVSSLMKLVAIRHLISINVRPTFLSTITVSWKTTALRSSEGRFPANGRLIRCLRCRFDCRRVERTSFWESETFGSDLI